MYDEGESSQKIQELANQLEQIANLVKGKINNAIKSSYLEQKRFFVTNLASQENKFELKKTQIEAVFAELQAADQRIEQDWNDIAQWGQETRDLLAKLKAEVV